MAFTPSARVEKTVRGHVAYFTLNWSSLHRADKYEIQKSVPAMAGLFELYYKDEAGKLFLFHSGKVWLGGLRAVIRETTDPILVKDRPDLVKILTHHLCYYRFSVCESLPDMEDLFGFFARTTGAPRTSATGRYDEVRVKEVRGA